MTNEARREWEIRIVRDAIDSDWAALASNELNAEQRRAVRDHLGVHIIALRDLAERHRFALKNAKINRLQNIAGAGAPTEF